MLHSVASFPSACGDVLRSVTCCRSAGGDDEVYTLATQAPASPGGGALDMPEQLQITEEEFRSASDGK